MQIQSVSLAPSFIRKTNNSNSLDNTKNFSESITKNAPLNQIPTINFLAQLPNVHFGDKFQYSQDDLSAYEELQTEEPSEMEQYKYTLSKKANGYKWENRPFSALVAKLQLASICKSQNKERDAFLLEEGVKELFRALPREYFDAAYDLIEDYNPEMAQSLL